MFILNYVLYFDPMENLQKSIAKQGENLVAAVQKRRQRQKATELINQIPESDRGFFQGLEDPADISKQRFDLYKTQQDDARAWATHQDTINKQKYDNAKAYLDNLYNNNLIDDEGYANGLTQLQQGNTDIQASENPEYGKPQGFFMKPNVDTPKFILGGGTKAQKDLSIYKNKKTVDEDFKKNEEVRSLRDKKDFSGFEYGQKKEFEGIQQGNKVKNIKLTGQEARKTKGSKSYSDKLKEEENAPTKGIRPEFKQSIDDIRRQIFGAAR